MKETRVRRPKGFNRSHELEMLKYFSGDETVCIDATIHNVAGSCRGARAHARELADNYLRENGGFIIPESILETVVEEM